MKKLSTLFMLIFFVLIFSSCFLNPYYNNTYNFDMSSSGNESSRVVRSLTASETVISSFDKYEIEVVYVYIALFDTEAIPGMSYDKKTIYNTTVGSGTKVDLVTEKLSDKLPLSVENPLGNAVDKIYVGLGPTVTAKGYVNMNGTVYRTRTDGTMTPDGASAEAEEGVFAVQGDEIPAFSADESNPAKEPNVKGIYLWLASGGHKHAGHDDLVFDGDGSTLDLKFPLENGLVKFNGEWMTDRMEWVTPYIANTSKYEKYYLKKKDAPYYTDIMRILTDSRGNAVVGQLRVGSLYTENSLFTGSYGLWYEADDVVDLSDAEIDAIYAQWFDQGGTDNSSSFYFKAAGGDTDVLSCTSFQRADHSGVFTFNGTTLEYDCLKVE